MEAITTTTITTEKQREKIKDFIQDELLKRGFLAKILNLIENKNCFNFQTEKFQTTPVLFKELKIIGYSHKFEKGIKEQYRFTIQCSSDFIQFYGGRNRAQLFRVAGILQDDEVFNLEVE